MRCNGMQWLMSQPRASGQSKVLGGWWLLGKGRVHKGEDLNLGKIRITNLNYIELYIQTASLFLTTLLLRHFRCWISCRSGGLARWQSLWEPITSRPEKEMEEGLHWARAGNVTAEDAGRSLKSWLPNWLQSPGSMENHGKQLFCGRHAITKGISSRDLCENQWALARGNILTWDPQFWSTAMDGSHLLSRQFHLLRSCKHQVASGRPCVQCTAGSLPNSKAWKKKDWHAGTGICSRVQWAQSPMGACMNTCQGNWDYDFPAFSSSVYSLGHLI